MFSNQNPRIETIIAPVRSYSLSIITNGAVLVIGTSNLFFSNCDLINSPNCPGVAESEKLEIYTRKFAFSGIKTLCFFNKIDQRRNKAIQLVLTTPSIIGT